MSELLYSDDALNVRNAFLRVKTLVYVEGDDDVLFWEEIFSHVPHASIEIEAAGGSDQIDVYIEKIAAGQLQAIAARDADFLPHLGKTKNDPRVIYTYGYAIENSLYTADCLANLTKLWCKTNKILASECADWLNDLVTHVRLLVHLDLANRIADAGAATIPDNCTRLMTGQASCVPCATKIGVHISSASAKVPPAELSVASTKIGTQPDDLLKWVRGHFLASAALKFVLSKAKSLGRKIDLSADSLYAAAIAHFGKSLGHSHPHKGYYLQSALAAYQSIN